MILSEKQKADLETVKYFIPRVLKHIKITNKDIEDYFNWSEKGIGESDKEAKRGTDTYTGFETLMEGKRWRGIHIHELYEQGILSGDMPYAVILEDMPREIIEFLKKEMFKGIDARVIEKVYEEVVR